MLFCVFREVALDHKFSKTNFVIVLAFEMCFPTELWKLCTKCTHFSKMFGFKFSHHSVEKAQSAEARTVAIESLEKMIHAANEEPIGQDDERTNAIAMLQTAINDWARKYLDGNVDQSYVLV